MKIVKKEGKWYFELPGNRSTPFEEYLREIVNRSLPNPIYCTGTQEEEGHFTVFSLVDEPENKTGQLIDQFSLGIFEDARLAAPLVILYAVKNHPLVDKVVATLGDCHPRNLIYIDPNAREIMPFMLEKIIKNLK